MVDMEMVFKTITEMTPEEMEALKAFIEQRDKMTYWVVPPENLAKLAAITRPLQEHVATMTKEEISTIIDEAMAEVRRERKHRLTY